MDSGFDAASMSTTSSVRCRQMAVSSGQLSWMSP